MENPSNSDMITFATVCSGIEAPSVAMPEWRSEWFSEIEPFPCELLAHRYPETPNLGDMTGIAKMVRAGEVSAPDVFIGGTPCQAFSVAGLRNGLSDERGALTISFAEIADAADDVRLAKAKPESVIWWENVPGVLTSKDNAFGCFLGALVGESCELQPPGRRWENAGCVYGPKRAVAWRVLDAQYFGLAQRRKRVFVVASARKGFDPSEILFEFDGVRRDSAPRREARESATYEIAPSLTASGRGVARVGDPHGQGPVVVVHGTQDPIVSTERAHALGRNNGAENAVYCGTQNDALRDLGREITPTLRSGSNGEAVIPMVGPIYRDEEMSCVRRLTPVECERLQGFPDWYTAIPWRNKPADDCPDGHRYKALGNSIAVPVMSWIGQRIQEALHD